MMKKTVLGLAAAAMLGFASQASAAVINIDATNNTGTTVNLAAGSYLLTFVGTSAPGGLYDGWNATGNVNCNQAGICSEGWLNAFIAVTPDNNATLFYVSVPGFPQALRMYATAGAALAGYQSATELHKYENGVLQGDTDPLPFRFDLAQSVNLKLLIGPGADGLYSNNVGGVSIDISAVPEPATWTMMILGLGTAGVMARGGRRKRALAAAI